MMIKLYLCCCEVIVKFKHDCAHEVKEDDRNRVSFEDSASWNKIILAEQ